MAVKHIVLFELHDSVTEADAEGMFGTIQQLLVNIPGVIDVSVGKNFTDRAPNVTHGAVVTLESKQALEGYGPHPNHVEVQGILKPNVKSVSAVDFEV